MGGYKGGTLPVRLRPGKPGCMGLISPILDRHLDLERVPTGLLALTAQSLGNAATASDGHAEDFQTAVSAFEFGAAQVAELEPLLLEHFGLAFDATEDRLKADTAQLARDLANGDQVLRDLDGLFHRPAPPPVVPSPSGDGSAGGGGGGEGPASSSACIVFGECRPNNPQRG